MTITPTKGDPGLRHDTDAELLIKEARAKTRRRRFRFGLLVLIVVGVVTALVATIGAGPIHIGSSTGEPSRGTATSRFNPALVANLAQANTIAASGSDVWVSILNQKPFSKHYAIVELNASTGALVRVIRSSDLEEPQSMVVYGGHLWVVNDVWGAVVELNANNGDVVREIGAKTFDAGGIAKGGSHLWIINSHIGTNSMTELNANNGSVVRVIKGAQYRFHNPGGVVANNKFVWVLNSIGDSITQINASSGALVRVINAHAGHVPPQPHTGMGGFASAEPVALAVGDNRLWVADQHDFANGSTVVTSLAEFNANSGEFVRRIVVKDGIFTFTRAMEVVGSHLWVVSSGGKTENLVELNAVTGSIERDIDKKSGHFDAADGLAISGSRISVLNIEGGNQGSVSVLNARNGALERVIK